MKHIYLGQNEQGEHVFAEVSDGVIRGFDYAYPYEDVYSEQTELASCAWMHSASVGGVEYKTGMPAPKGAPLDALPEHLRQDAERGYNPALDTISCERCGAQAYSDASYYPDFPIRFIHNEDGDFTGCVCTECLQASDVLKRIEDAEDLFKAGNLDGIEVPEEYVEVDTLFCDGSSFGAEYERALTKSQALARTEELIEEHGQLFAGLTGIGQFQVYVTLYKLKGEEK